MRVMLTGGTGFIGSYVAEQLLSEGHDLTLLARNPRKVAGFVDRPGIRFVEGSIADRHAVQEALDGAEACIHVARAKATVGSDALLADTLAAVELFEDACDAGVTRLIYTSSIAVFNESGEDAFSDTSVQRPTTVYGATKAAAEAYLVGMASGTSTTVASIRPGYTFGNPVTTGAPTQAMPELPRIARAASRGEPISVVKDAGLQFIWAGDLARVYLAALASTKNREYYTSLSPEFYTWEEIARWAIELAGSTSEIVLEETDHARRPLRWSVDSINRDFGLVFNAEARMKEHLAYWLTQA